MATGNLFAFDFGSDVIKVAYVNVERELEYVHLLPVKQYDNPKRRHIEISKAIKTFLGSRQLRTSSAVFSFSSRDILLKTVNLTCGKGDNIADQVHSLIQNSSHFIHQDTSSTFRIIGQEEQDQTIVYRLLVTAVPRHIVEEYVTLLQAAGLTVLGAVPSPFCLEAALPAVTENADRHLLFIDFGAESTDLVFIRNSSTTFYRSLGTGGRAITREIQEYYHSSFEEAEKTKKNLAIPTPVQGASYTIGQKDPAAVIEPVLDILITDIKRSINYYINYEQGNRIDEIYLTGGDAQIPNLAPFLQHHLGVKVNPAPYRGEYLARSGIVATTADFSSLANMFLQSLPILGLVRAIRSDSYMNLHNAPRQEEDLPVTDKNVYTLFSQAFEDSAVPVKPDSPPLFSRLRETVAGIRLPAGRPALLAAAIGFVTILLFCFAYLQHSASSLQQRIKINEQTMNRLNLEVSRVRDYQQQIRKLENELAQLQKGANIATLSRTLRYFTSFTSGNAFTFTRIEFKGEQQQIHIIGETDKGDTFAAFIAALRENPEIAGTRIVYIAKKSDSFEFELLISLKK